MVQLPEIKNIIMVASGKGGVGKSTTAVNLALALLAENLRAGLLDADIYGPSQPLMLGATGEKPEAENEKMRPVMRYGLQTMSMGYLVNPDTAMVWRGPMVSNALMQLVAQTRWENLDYLLIDLPPGTGDIQLTLAQKIPVTGAVIVTTPQDIALIDARKAIAMFQKVHVPVLGIVENMSMYHCPQCGHEAAIFGIDGAGKMAEEMQIEMLGKLPLDIHIREQTDSGTPPVVADPDSAVSGLYGAIARKLIQKTVDIARLKSRLPKISIVHK